MYLRLSKLILTLSILLPFSSFAVEINEKVTLSGFVGIGTANFTAYNQQSREFERDWNKIIEGGLTLSAELDYGFELNTQALYSNVERRTEESARLDYLTLDWHSAHLNLGEQTISLGRIKAGGGIYSQTRYMPFTRPTIFLPTSVYPENTQHLASRIDGVRLASNFYLGSGDLNIEFVTGTPSFDDDLVSELGPIGTNVNWNEDRSHFIDIRYQNSQWLLTFSRTDIEASLNGQIVLFNEANQPFIYRGNNSLEFTNSMLGVQYQNYRFEVTAEYSHLEINNINNLANVNLAQDIDGYYVHFKYFLTPNINLLTRFEDSDFDIMVNQVNFRSEQLLPSNQYTLGLTWRINASLQFNIEGHRIITSRWNQNLGLMEFSWRF